MRRVVWILSGALAAAALIALTFPRSPGSGGKLGTDRDARAAASPAPTIAPAPAAFSEPGLTPTTPSAGDPDRNSQGTRRRSNGGGGQKPAGSKCPDPTTCTRYELLAGRWPRTNGKVVIDFRINVLNQPWFVNEDDRLEAAALAAAEPWELAHPDIDFVFDGFTQAPPVSGDDEHVIGWLPLGTEDISQTLRHDPEGDGILNDLDTQLNSVFPWAWSQCEQRDGSCMNIAHDQPPRPFDVQNTLAHEFGHWIGLEDLPSDDAETDLERNLTMYDFAMPGWRKQATLGLGDVLGARAAFACVTSPCDEEVVYVP